MMASGRGGRTVGSTSSFAAEGGMVAGFGRVELWGEDGAVERLSPPRAHNTRGRRGTVAAMSGRGDGEDDGIDSGINIG